MRRTLVCSTMLVVALWGSTARADDDASPLYVTLGRIGDSVTASFDVKSALTERFRKRLSNGLTSRVVVDMRLIDPNDRPIATTSRRCFFQWDIWDEVLEVRIEDGPIRKQTLKRKLLERGMRDCALMTDVLIAHRTLLTVKGDYHLEVFVQLNPISEEQLQRAKGFMSNPRSSRVGRPRSFFDTVLSIFGGQKYRDDEFLFRSQLLPQPGRGR